MRDGALDAVVPAEPVDLVVDFRLVSWGAPASPLHQDRVVSDARGYLHVSEVSKGLVLDSLHDIFGGEENRRPHARQFINLLRDIAIATDGAVIVTAHPSLSGRASGTGEAGSTAWGNAVRSRLYLSVPADEDDENVRILATKKSNYGARGKDLRLKWIDGVFINVGVLEDRSPNLTAEANNAA